MSILRRIALVLRSYVATAEDRIDAIAAAEAAREAASRKRAIEEIRELSREPEAVPVTTRRRAESAALAANYRFLGLEPGADLQAVEEAWRRLAGRADPKRFPAGSDEEKRAARLLKSINEAYEHIREALIPTEGRFGQLEL